MHRVSNNDERAYTKACCGLGDDQEHYLTAHGSLFDHPLSVLLSYLLIGCCFMYFGCSLGEYMVYSMFKSYLMRRACESKRLDLIVHILFKITDSASKNYQSPGIFCHSEHLIMVTLESNSCTPLDAYLYCSTLKIL